jgi:hypothetical protein
MIIHYVKKIWYGDETYQKAKITLRSYWVDQAVRGKQDIEVRYDGKYMTLSPRRLKRPLGKRFFKSKIGKDDYELLDYSWKPDQ